MLCIKNLWDNQKAYQGMLFREAVELAQHFVQNTTRKYIFVGFGLLKKAESNLIQELLEAGKAEIYWDIPKQFTALYHNQKLFPFK
jgi:ATP-dependent helicase/nuclease subunit B